MESHQEQLASPRIDDDADDGKRDWASLPHDLVRTIMGAPQLKRDKAAKWAALASCKAFGRAVMRASSHNLGMQLDHRTSFSRRARFWAELWGGEPRRQGQDAGLALFSVSLVNPALCFGELLSAGLCLPFVTQLSFKGLSLDVLLPPGVSALLPNLQVLAVVQCIVTPAARATLLDAGCSRLWQVQIEALSAQQQAPGALSLQQLATAQLRQLAILPSLSNIMLKDASCSTLFLIALGTQLTRLVLHESSRQCLPGTQTPTPAWRATLQHIARCTRLLELNIPCATAEELGLVAPALQQLRTLELNHVCAVEADGDAMAEVLLGLPHLTSLRWDNASLHTFKRWHTDRPCRWETLFLGVFSAPQLARLPLHSLKQPVQLWGLVVKGAALREVRAAVANATRGSPAGFRWEEVRGDPPHLALDKFVAGSETGAPAVLRVLQPLLASLPSGLGLVGAGWDTEPLSVLGEVLPRTCTRLMLGWGWISREALEQVARSLPWVRFLQLKEQDVSPEDVVAFVRLARRLKQQEGGAGEVRLEEVVVEKPFRPEGVGERKHRKAWEEAEREVRKRGGGVVLKLVW